MSFRAGVVATAMLLLAAQSGCPGVNKCKTGTLYVTANMPAPSTVDLTIDVLVDGGFDYTATLANTAGQSSGSVEIGFATGYPTGKSVTVVVTGMVNGTATSLSGAVTLVDGCSALTLSVGDPPDLSGFVDPHNNLNCGAGTHGCGPECVTNTSTDNCGPTSCKPCAVPVHGIATCDSDKCDVKCEPGYNACAGDCKSQDDPLACGPSCTACVLPTNAMSATCDGGRCGFVCKPGFHACGAACVDNTDIANCGSVSCTACAAPTGPGGTAVCDGVKCGTQCNDAGFPQLCNGVCVAAADACTGTCPSGDHACNGMCPALTDLNSCGTLCNSPCPTDASGVTMCDGTTCSLVCEMGYHLCVVNGAQVCISNRSSKSCGNTTAACSNICTTTSPHSVSTCVGDSAGIFACQLGCAAGYHACTDGNGAQICASNTDPKYGCGVESCTTCTLPTNGTATSCAGGQCNFDCKTGFHKCGSGCGDNSNINTCGTNCGPCSTTGLPANASAICQAQGPSFVCTFKCDAGYVNCGGLCVRADDPAHGCGSCGAACGAPSGASAICVGSGICDYSCGAGVKCMGGCFDPTQNASCGPSCQTCTAPSGGTVSCNGTSCVPACPSGQTICAPTNSCITTGAPCNGSCAGGTHLCGGVCVSDASTSQCGTACADCTTANATVACQGGACVVTACAGGYHQCNGAGGCYPDGDTGHCGGTCAACATTVGNATNVCNGSCTFQCSSGSYCAAANACIGGCCNASDCPLATNATATCSIAGGTGTCVYSCNSPWVNCSGQATSVAGCTSQLGSQTNCSACGAGCTVYQSCSGSACYYDCVSNCDCGCNTTKTGCKACPCFVAGTQVTLADGTTKAIETVVVGDTVRAYDEATGTVKSGTVSTLFVHPETHDFITLRIGTRSIITTPEHPFFVDGRWVKAGQLVAGDTLSLLEEGTLRPLRLDTVTRYSGTETTYNLNVEPYRTYFVDGILVHNKIPN